MIKTIKIQIDTENFLERKYKLGPVGFEGRSTTVILPPEYLKKLARELGVTSISDVRKHVQCVWHTAEGFDGLILTFLKEKPNLSKKKS